MQSIVSFDKKNMNKFNNIKINDNSLNDINKYNNINNN